MSDWESMILRHEGTGADLALSEVSILGAFYEDKRDLSRVLTAFEEDLARTERDLDTATSSMDRFQRQLRDQTRALQSLVDEIKEVLVSGMSWNMNDWDDLVNAFSRFDGLDLDQPRREWRAEVEVTVLMSLSGDAPGDIDENQIADLVGQHFGKGDIDINLMFTDGHDDVDANDQNILGYDISVDVDFDD